MKHQQWVGLVIGVMFGISTMLPAQASVLSQSPVVTVTGGHYYNYTYYQNVQTGTQQVQTGTQQVQTGTYQVQTGTTTHTIPVYTLEPVYTTEPTYYTETVYTTEWSPATITTS